MVDIAGLETAAYHRDAAAGERMLQLLLLLGSGGKLVDDAEPGEDEAAERRNATRIAAAVTSILADPGQTLPAATLTRLATVGNVLGNLFAASGFDGSDAAVALLVAESRAGKGGSAMKAAQLIGRLTALISFDSRLPRAIEAVYDFPPQQQLLAFLRLLGAKPLTTVEGDLRRDALLAASERLAEADLPATPDHLVLLANAWMMASYAHLPEKHRVKARLNRVIRRAHKGFGIEELPLPPRRPGPDGRPVLVVASEIMHSNHVQYRYFGQYCRQLRQRFHTVLVTDQREIDDHVRGMFDQCWGFRRSGNGLYLGEIVRFIRETAPDVLYWPSVGMRHWGVTLANLRLAPLQLLGLGHTATTHMENLDFCMAEAGLVGDPSVYAERLVLIPDEAHILERSPHYRPIAPELRAQPTPVRVALASNLLKLNPRYLTFLAGLAKEASRPVEFHLFPNVSGIELTVTRQAVRRLLPGAVVHPILSYNSYLRQLNGCDLSFSPFPFGGMHSVIDATRQGLPVVALLGQEPHARTDAMLLRRFDMPEDLIADSEASYRRVALRLIEDDAYRLAVSHKALAADVDRRIYAQDSPARREFVDAVWWLYQNRAEIEAGGRRLFTRADWTGVPEPPAAASRPADLVRDGMEIMLDFAD